MGKMYKRCKAIFDDAYLRETEDALVSAYKDPDGEAQIIEVAKGLVNKFMDEFYYPENDARKATIKTDQDFLNSEVGILSAFDQVAKREYPLVHWSVRNFLYKMFAEKTIQELEMNSAMDGFFKDATASLGQGGYYDPIAIRARQANRMLEQRSTQNGDMARRLKLLYEVSQPDVSRYVSVDA